LNRVGKRRGALSVVGGKIGGGRFSNKKETNGLGGLWLTRKKPVKGKNTWRNKPKLGGKKWWHTSYQKEGAGRRAHST